MAIRKELLEREKELDCLYHLSLLFANYEGDERSLFQMIEVELTQAMTYPESTRIILSIEPEPPPVQGSSREHYYCVKVPLEHDEYIVLQVLFLQPDIVLEHREEFLLESVLRLSASTIQRLRNASALFNKNLVLTELLNHLQDEKDKTRKMLSIKINAVVFPLLHQIESGLDEQRKAKLKMIKTALIKLTQQSQKNLSELISLLTPRELEICGLISTGSSSKEIAEMLGISCQTVERHRCTIRKKLGLNKTSINLSTHLLNL